MSTPIERESRYESAEQSRLMLWIDGVGAFLLCLGQRVSIGGPAVDSDPAEIPLLANLSRRHATFVRNGEGYLLEAHSLTRVAGRPIAERTYLNDGYDLEFGDSVRLRFRLPSVLSSSARLEFLSNHRPAYNVDGVILMDESCLIGPGAENHVQCSDWPESVVLLPLTVLLVSVTLPKEKIPPPRAKLLTVPFPLTLLLVSVTVLEGKAHRHRRWNLPCGCR